MNLKALTIIMFQTYNYGWTHKSVVRDVTTIFIPKYFTVLLGSSLPLLESYTVIHMIFNAISKKDCMFVFWLTHAW